MEPCRGIGTPIPRVQSWFTTYGYYNATTSYHQEMPCWIYDSTTGETSPVNQTDLTHWPSGLAAQDSDGDGLPDWYEFLIGTSPYAWSTVYDGISDGWKVQHGLNPLDPTVATRIAAAGGWTNLQYYQAGLNPNIADSDGNGLPDWWELQNFGTLGVNPNADPDQDGLTNLQEYQIGSNPNAASTVGDGIPDGWKVQHGLDPLDANGANEVAPGSGGLTYLQVYQGLVAFTMEVDLGRFTHGLTLNSDLGVEYLAQFRRPDSPGRSERRRANSRWPLAAIWNSRSRCPACPRIGG